MSYDKRAATITIDNHISNFEGCEKTLCIKISSEDLTSYAYVSREQFMQAVAEYHIRDEQDAKIEEIRNRVAA